VFGERLVEALRKRGPLCVGIDPHAALLEEWGLTDDSRGLAKFCDTVVEALGDEVAIFKPQSAFFERFGSAGIAVLESTIRQCRERGALVLLDVKRGDIGTTGQAYAAAYLNPSSALFVDAVTVSPYLGIDSLEPFFTAADQHGCGVFVLALTSNPGEGGLVQHARVADGRTVAQSIIDEVGRRNGAARPRGSFGVVIGATTGATGHDLSSLGGPVLAPGLGAQGATAADLPTVLAGLNGVAVPSYSRSILRHGPSIKGLQTAARTALEECRKVHISSAFE
jgi:orotidine-5'-phosphate decarboxylase